MAANYIKNFIILDELSTIMKEEDIDKAFERFPELERIENDKIMYETIKALSLAPDYFWDVPATTVNKYHNPYSRSTHGLWIHTKMVFTAFERISESWLELGLISEEEVDYGRSACLIHDLFKNGLPENYEEGDSSTRDHELTAATEIYNKTELPEEVIIAVSSHMGPWYEGFKPKNYLSLLIHTCDMIASSKNITCGIYKPNKEINNKYPSIPNSYY